MDSAYRIFSGKCVDQETSDALWSIHCRFNQLVAQQAQLLYHFYTGKIKFAPDLRLTQRILNCAWRQSNTGHIIGALSADWPKTLSGISQNMLNDKQEPELMNDYLAAKSCLDFSKYTDPTSKQNENYWPQFSKVVVDVAVDQVFTYIMTKEKTDVERRKQLADRKKYLADNPNFAAVVPILDDWFNTYGQTKTPYRWVNFLRFLSSNDTIIGWDNNYVVNDNIDLDYDSKSLTRQFKEKYPSLNRLLECNKKYKKFIVRKPHTFTLPHYRNHPQWVKYTRKSPATILKDIQVCDDYLLIQFRAADGKQWMTARCSCDRRLHGLRFENGNYFLKLVESGIEVDHQLMNVTVMFPNARRVKNPIAKVLFTFKLNDYKKLYIPTKKVGKVRELAVPDGVYITGIDLGLRTKVTLVTAMTGPSLLIKNCAQIQSVQHTNQVLDQNHRLDNIENLISRKQKNSRKFYNKLKMVIGLVRKSKARKSKHSFCNRLYHRRNNIMIDYARQLAHKCIDEIVKFNDRDHYVVIEDLRSLLPDPEKGGFYNRRLTRMMREQFRLALVSLAAKHRLCIIDTYPAGSSQLHYACGSLGVRLDRERKRQAFCGPWFYCGECHECVDSDKNAAINLIKYIVSKWRARWPSDKGNRDKLKREVIQQFNQKIITIGDPPVVDVL